MSEPLPSYNIFIIDGFDGSYDVATCRCFEARWLPLERSRIGIV